MKRLLAFATVAVAAGALAACREQASDEPPILLERNMYDSERYNAQGYTDFWGDHRNMRQPPDGTMAREYYDDNRLDQDEYATGLVDGGRGGYVMTVPQLAVDRFGGMAKTLERGEQRYNIYCAPCHSKVGDGLGTVVVRTNGRLDANGQPVNPGPFAGIPDFTQARIRQMPDGQVFNTITHGLSRMPAYGAQIPIADRWAIVSYLRALQLSQVAVRTAPEDKK